MNISGDDGGYGDAVIAVVAGALVAGAPGLALAVPVLLIAIGRISRARRPQQGRSVVMLEQAIAGDGGPGDAEVAPLVLVALAAGLVRVRRQRRKCRGGDASPPGPASSMRSLASWF